MCKHPPESCVFMNIIQTEVIFLNLQRQADEFVFSILGDNPTPDAGSFRSRLSALFAMFDVDKQNFVESPVNLGFLAILLREYNAFRKSEITQVGTPEILIGQIRWNDIYDRPDLAPEAHTHVRADVSDFPATMPPEAHTHVRADVSDFPATMPPEAHSHVRADVSDFPSAMPPEAHTHVKADVSDFPATMPPDAHAHEFADILFKPETYPPDNHTHTVSWPDVINKQASYPPSIHSHEIAWGEITSKPADLKKISFVSWTGDGTTNRVLTTTFQVNLVQVVANNGLSGIATVNGALRTTTATLIGAFTYGAMTLTLNAVELNVSGVGYTAIIFGAV